MTGLRIEDYSIAGFQPQFRRKSCADRRETQPLDPPWGPAAKLGQRTTLRWQGEHLVLRPMSAPPRRHSYANSVDRSQNNPIDIEDERLAWLLLPQSFEPFHPTSSSRDNIQVNNRYWYRVCSHQLRGQDRCHERTARLCPERPVPLCLPH